MENREHIEELLKNVRKDRSAAVELLKLFSNDMYREARLYTSDQQLAKNLVLQAFRNALKEIGTADADEVQGLLKEAVQKECIQNILPLEVHSSDHTSEDEIPDTKVNLPSDSAVIKKQLRAVLNRLTPSERVICVLKYRDGLSDEQIAQKCNISEEQVGFVLTDTKQTLNKEDINFNTVLALVENIYPFYEKQKAAADKGKKELSEDELFDSSVLELKEFFHTGTISAKKISDQQTDEGEYVQNDAVEESSEDENTAMIMTAALSAESDKKKHDEKYNPVTYWVKRIALILIVSLIAFGIGVLLSMMHTEKKAEEDQKEPEITETAEAEETADIEESEEPQETPEPESTPEADLTVGKAYILVTDLSIRKGPGVAYEQAGLAEVETTYDVYEMKDGDGYIWYRIGEDQWVPDFQGQYVTYTPNA